MQPSYWLPFPVQSMPNNHLTDVQAPSAFAFSDVPSESHWQQQFTLPSHSPAMQQQLHPHHQQFLPRQHPPPTRSEDQIGQAFGNWHWQ